MESVPTFEQMLVRCGIHLFKYYLDIGREEQKKRLAARCADPLTQWKLSPIDEAAQKYWHDYSVARNEMLARSHSPIAPWTVVRANDKRLARLNVIRDLLSHLDYPDKDHSVTRPDPAVVFPYMEIAVDNGMIES